MTGENFKERVRQEIIKYAKPYKDVYVDYEYLICSKSLKKCDYYIIAAQEDNYQHLTGVHSKISAQTFFEKCYSGELTEHDFDFIKKGQNEKNVKGTVRRKIKALPAMMNLFRNGVQIEEDFERNLIACSFATTDGNCTLGFINIKYARPKSLIKGNSLKNPNPVDIILRKAIGQQLFDEIVVGDISSLKYFKNKIHELVPENMFTNE